MRALTIAIIAFAAAAAFGIGVLVGRFVLGDDQSMRTESPLPPLPAQASTALPSDAPPAYIPPPPVKLPSDVAASAASEAISAPGGCSVRLARPMALRSFAKPDRMVVAAKGDVCADAVISVSVQGTGGLLYNFSAPASELGFSATPGVTQESLQGFLNRLAPEQARSAAKLPVWVDGGPDPTLPRGASLQADRSFYEAIRVQGAPLFCHRISSSATRCVAVDPDDGQTKVVLQEGN